MHNSYSDSRRLTESEFPICIFFYLRMLMILKQFLESFVHFIPVLLARDVIYTSRAYATMSVSVCLSVCPSVCDGSALAHYS